MGFRLLALLNAKNINYTQMSKVITNAKINWNERKVKDENSVMIKILAELDFALVDVIEKQI